MSLPFNSPRASTSVIQYQRQQILDYQKRPSRLGQTAWKEFIPGVTLETNHDPYLVFNNKK